MNLCRCDLVFHSFNGWPPWFEAMVRGHGSRPVRGGSIVLSNTAVGSGVTMTKQAGLLLKYCSPMCSRWSTIVSLYCARYVAYLALLYNDDDISAFDDE